MTMLKIAVSPADHHLGTEGAPVVLVEYGDYQCPHCAHAVPVVRYVRERFGDQLRFVFRHFPLTGIHPYAEQAAEAAEFAGAHGMFWQMHDLLFENQAQLGDLLFPALANALDLSTTSMQEALANGRYRERIAADFDGGIRSGVNGTPTFFINGQRHDGANDEAGLAMAIEQILARGRSAP